MNIRKYNDNGNRLYSWNFGVRFLRDLFMDFINKEYWEEKKRGYERKNIFLCLILIL